MIAVVTITGDVITVKDGMIIHEKDGFYLLRNPEMIIGKLNTILEETGQSTHGQFGNFDIKVTPEHIVYIIPCD